MTKAQLLKKLEGVSDDTPVNIDVWDTDLEEDVSTWEEKGVIYVGLDGGNPQNTENLQTRS